MRAFSFCPNIVDHYCLTHFITPTESVKMYLTYFKGTWSEGNTPLFGAMDHAVWLGSSVFDGARSIRGHVPDLRLHLARVLKSAHSLGLQCPYNIDELEALCHAGIKQFPADAELYIRPLVFGTDGLLIPESEKSGFALTLFDAAMPPFSGWGDGARRSSRRCRENRIVSVSCAASCALPRRRASLPRSMASP